MSGDNRRVIAVADFETDRFKEWGPDTEYECGQVPFPFCAEVLLSETEYVQFWGDDCVEQLYQWLMSCDTPLLLYFHNGGKFDLFLKQKNGFSLLSCLQGKLRIINRRIVKAFIGIHEVRDSFAIFPEALETFKGKHSKQTGYDYTQHDENRRECCKANILSYMHDDCLTLHEHCSGFHKEFGDGLTIGGVSMRELRKRHEFDSFTGSGATDMDALYREWFFGGRSQCFKTGIIEGAYRIYDVNGMYQEVMRSFNHPLGASFSVGKKITNRTNFVTLEAKNYGCLPMRTRQGVTFDVPEGVFKCTIHEYIAGLETGTLEPIRIIETRQCDKQGNFAEFIEHFTRSKLEAELAGDSMRRGFYKRVQNAAYGRFALNPENFYDYQIVEGSELLDEPWEIGFEFNGFRVWQRPTLTRRYENVAIAASITGAARSVLLRGLCAAIDPVYCDTDSIICLDLPGVDVSDTVLGAWKLEGKKDADGVVHYEADSIAIAGKKLYSVFDGNMTLKQANKGVRITAEQIRKIAGGGKVRFNNPAPSFRLGGGVDFVSREVRSTGVAGSVGRKIPKQL